MEGLIILTWLIATVASLLSGEFGIISISLSILIGLDSISDKLDFRKNNTSNK